MKFKTLPLCLSLLLSVAASSTWAEETAANEEKVLPTEVSEAPYEVGQLPAEQGYYIDRGDELTQINFRIVNTQMRVYWIDADGLIAEPEAKAGNVRFTGTVRGRAYYGLERISGDVGIGSPAVIPAPHIFNIILTLEDGDNSTTYNFRYTANMDKASIPEGAKMPAAEKPKSSTY